MKSGTTITTRRSASEGFPSASHKPPSSGNVWPRREAGFYAFLGRENNRDRIRTATARTAIRSTFSNGEVIRLFKIQKFMRAIAPIQRLLGMTSRIPQPMQGCLQMFQ